MISNIDPDFYSDNPKILSMRDGVAKALLDIGEQDEKVIVLTADLSSSVRTDLFEKEIGFPRFIDVGIAEQNLVTVASGLAASGLLPYVAAYSAFSPGRNWEQIRTTICLNNQPVKIIGSHVGITVGPDGATHQMLEDIALMRVLPNMQVFSPCDAIEAENILKAIKDSNIPAYVRISREKTTILTPDNQDFAIGKSYLYKEGKDVLLIGTGLLTQTLLKVAKRLALDNIDASVLHVPTIKPFLDVDYLKELARKHKFVVTAEEHQKAGGMGSMILEKLAEEIDIKIKVLGIDDKFGQSGKAKELLTYYELDENSIYNKVKQFIDRK